MNPLHATVVLCMCMCLGLLAGCDPKPQPPKASQLRQETAAVHLADAVQTATANARC